MKCKEMYDESIDDFFKELSQKYFIKIIYGAISKKDDLYYNSLIAVDGQKELLRYDKIHPFLKERNYFIVVMKFLIVILMDIILVVLFVMI